MAQLLIRNIPAPVLEDFKARATMEGIAAETLARRVIAEASQRPSVRQAIQRMKELRAMTPRPVGSMVDLVRESRDGDDSGH